MSPPLHSQVFPTRIDVCGESMSYPTNPYDPTGSQPDVPALPAGSSAGEYPGGEYPGGQYPPNAGWFDNGTQPGNGPQDGYGPQPAYGPGYPGYGAPPGYGPYPGYGPPAYPGKSKVAAGILALFLGTFGIHNFYLGYTNKGLIQLLGSFLSCGFLAVPIAIWAFIEGILILTARPGEPPWGVDATGVPLSG